MLWKVTELREYVRKRGLKTLRQKEELCASACAANKVRLLGIYWSWLVYICQTTTRTTVVETTCMYRYM